jgi:hypothetical protein
MRLDRTVYRAYNFKTQSAENNRYKLLSLTKLANVFNYLQGVAYNFEINYYSIMDKTVYSCRKNG